MPSTAVARAIKQAHQKASGGPVNLCSDDEDGDEARKPATGRRSRPQRPKTRGSAAEDDPELKSPRAMIQQWMSRHPEAGTKQLFTYPFSGLNAITIAPEDAMRLEHWEYLNDNLLEWYFRVLLLEKCRNRADEVHIFNTFFYTRLKKAVELEPKKSDAKSADASADPPVNQEFERVLRFCKNVDLFTKRLVIVPINENLHWYLAVIANPGKLLVDPPELATAARDEESAASTTSASASAADSNAGADAGWASATGSRTEQHAQRTTADGGMVGMDTTTSALGDQDEFGPDAEAATRPPSSAAPSDKGSVEGDDEPGSTTPRAAQSPVKNGTSKSDQDSPTHSGYASYSAPPSPQLYAADLDARDMEPDVPASDSSMHTKAGRWDDEDDNKETAVAMIQRSNASLRAPRYDQDESMQVDDSIIIGGSPEPEAMTVDVVTVGDEDTEDEKMELSEEDDDAKTDGTTTSAYFPAPPKKYNARANRPVRPTTSLPVPANMPRKPTPLTAPVAAPTPLPESKASIGVSPGSAASTTTAAASGTTSSARSSGSSKDTTYDPDNDVLIVVLDSLNNPRTQPANNLEKYLKRLAVKRGYTVLDNPPIRKPKPKSPRQPNSCDCGVYLLHYVERLLLDTDHMLQHFARVPGVDTKALWVDEEIPKKRVAMTDMVTNYAELYLAQVKSKKMDDASAAEESDHDEIQEVVSKDAPEPEPVSNKRASGGQRLGGRSKAELDAAAAEAGRQVECAEADQHRRDMYSAEFFGDDSHDEQRFARDTATHHDQPRTFPGLPPLPHGHLAPSPSSQTMYAARDRVAKSRPDTPLHHASHVATRELCHVLDSDDDDGDINSAAGQPSVDDGEGDDDLVVPRSRHVPRFKFASGANISARPPPSVPDPFAASKIGYQSGIHGRGFNDVDADIENDDDNKSPEHLHIGDTSPSQKTRAVAADDDVSHDFEMSARYQSRPASQGQSQHYAAGSHTRDQHHFHDLAPRPRAPDAAPNPLPIASSASRHSVIDSGEQDGSGAGNNSNDEEFDAGEFVFHNQPALAASKPTAAIELSDSDEDETRDGSNSRPSPKSTTSSSAPGADDDEDSEYDPCRDPANATHRFTTEPIPSSTATDSALLSKPSTKRPRPVHPSLRNNTAASTSQSASRPASPVLSSPIQVGRASSSVTTAASTVKHAQVDLTGDTDTDDEEQRAGPQPPGAKSSGRSAKAKSGSDTHAPSQVRAPRGRGQVQFPDADVNEAEVQVQPRRSTRSKAGSVIEKRRAEAAAKRH
ncbi:hypothetical protein BCR44DRAFT_46083 [Catenaria anguillulae PL171]|uniref:Ubiquitin-like protease family profile domain-containing protein n=1 Tax=Catenaria anguillulae PL171 TaxID=765915 RepID=A0A1Y2H5I7_9FUNG|nr:hypothetical protein BCR44DRAFT_46083 [Catenaria anguillulae PL171]